MRRVGFAIVLVLLFAHGARADLSLSTGSWTVLSSSASPNFRAYGSIAWDKHNRKLWYYAGFTGDDSSIDSGVDRKSVV